MREVYRDRWLVVVDKPSGLPSQPARGGSDSVIGRLGSEARLPHRLDAGASGLLVVVLHPAATRPVAEAFARREVRREYVAVLDGDAEAAVWERPVGGKRARSTVEVVGRGAGATAVRLRLDTGRKHQLRIHAALAGHPIWGDRRYGGEVAGRWTRLCLHAERLQLTHPITGETLTLQATAPGDMDGAWSAAGGSPLVTDA